MSTLSTKKLISVKLIGQGQKILARVGQCHFFVARVGSAASGFGKLSLKIQI